MVRLLQLEYYKNLSYRPFKVFTLLYFGIIVILLFIGLVDFQISDHMYLNLKEQGIYNFPGIWNFTTYIVGLLKIFLGFIIIFSITQEFSNRMFKQNIIDGLSRKEFVMSKLLTIIIMTSVSTLLVFFITLFLGYQYSENKETALVTEEMFFVANYFVELLIFFCFLMFLSILFRKSVFVFLALIVWWFVEVILHGIESVIKVRDLKDKQEILAAKDSFYLSDLLPLNSMSALIPNPLMRLNFAKIFNTDYVYHYPTVSLISCLVWCVIFIVGSYFILKKKDW